jgi:serine protease Do
MFRSIIGTRRLRLAAVLAPAFIFVTGAAQLAHSGGISSRDEVRESVVRIEVEHAQGTRQGTGFIINDNRTIATNNHVIEGAKAIWVTFLANGKPTSIAGRLIATDPVKDMALIETIGDIFGEPIVMADYDTNPPAKVTAIGYPVAADFVAGGLLPTIMLEPSYSVGTVARIVSNAKMLGGARLIQHTAAVNPGNSGGPLFDNRGQVVGVTNMKLLGGEGLNFAIPIAYVKHFLKNRDAFAFDQDNPNTGYRYLDAPRRRNPGSAPQ